ncbi:hypothetical protein GGS23DRAFT_606208 [Durotheca rogersii]|uniref:uncharacterized protein n=1 Tax=Durotheca rogersii TaxID=419775 RepID=UPI00221F37BB|nr:uncharacterized protein GGS23DRAFT_606208 [Durotheca rogersii]KAI5861664.1 hypothetical protein GGS23DRAFT_606208 [Durotheca rogersii]
MEHMLRCNALKCRKELGDRALVTTCSHIFCTDCAARLGLTSQHHEHRNSCPACGAHLTNPDDAVISNLNPSEDYKTSVLSGLSPNIIIECASRALSFWAYQATQEVVYQEYLGKTLTDKYSNLSVHLDKVINDANLEITNLHNKLTRKSSPALLKPHQDSLRRKNEELTQAYKEKNRKLLQTQELYDKLKRKAMLGQMQDAAEDAVDSTLHGPIGEAPFDGAGQGGGRDPMGFQEHGSPYGRQQPGPQERQGISTGYQTRATTQEHASAWPRNVGHQPNIPITPSTHRQRLGNSRGIGLSSIPGIVLGTPRAHDSQMNTREPVGDVTSNGPYTTTRFPSGGLISGLKASHSGANTGGFTASSARPQVAHRATAASSTFNRRSSGVQQETVLGGIRRGFPNL